MKKGKKSFAFFDIFNWKYIPAGLEINKKHKVKKYLVNLIQMSSKSINKWLLEHNKNKGNKSTE